MAVAGGRTIDRLAQVEHFDNAARAQIEMFTDQIDDGVVADLAGAESVHRDGGGLGHADGVAHLDLALAGQPGGDNVLGHVTPGVGRATVDLGRILAGEGAATVACHAAVGVHDDFAAGQATVTHGATDHENPGGVHVVQGVLVQPFFR